MCDSSLHIVEHSKNHLTSELSELSFDICCYLQMNRPMSNIAIFMAVPSELKIEFTEGP